MGPKDGFPHCFYPEISFTRIFFPTSSNRYVHLRPFSGNLKPQISTPTYPLQVHQSTFSPCTLRSKIISSKVAFVDCREKLRFAPFFFSFLLLLLKPAFHLSFSFSFPFSFSLSLSFFFLFFTKLLFLFHSSRASQTLLTTNSIFFPIHAKIS